MASMAIVVSSMDLLERPRNQRPTDPPTTTQKPETTTEDTSNRILSLPDEEKCMKSKLYLWITGTSLEWVQWVQWSSLNTQFLNPLILVENSTEK